MIELARVGEHALSRGRCIGELRIRDVAWRDGHLERVRGGVFDRWCRHPIATMLHQRRGHDAMCAQFGVPYRTFARFVSSWGGAHAAQLLCEALEEAVQESGSTGGLYGTPRELLTYAIGRRITIHTPADQLG